MSRIHRKPQPVKPCIFTDSADVGFGDPESWACTAPATHRSHRYLEASPVGPPYLTRIQACDLHAAAYRALIAGDGPPLMPRIYRFRRTQVQA